MNFWQNMWSPIRSFFTGRQAEGTQLTGPGGYATASASSVSEESALQVSAVWACVRLLSQTVASLPVIVYRKTPTGRVVDTDHWFAKLMARKPNQYQTRYEFWEYLTGNLVFHGNFYAKINRLSGAIMGLRPLASQQMETRLVAGKVVHLYSADNNVDALAAESVWHVRMNGDWLVGRSPLAFGRNIFGVAQAVEASVSKVYSNGAKPSGVLSVDKLLTEAQREQLRGSFSTLTTGDDNRLLVLELGAKFEAISMSPQEIETMAARKYNVDEIARWFGVPSILINQNEGSTTLGSSTGEILSAFYKLNLRPILEAIECSISANLFTEAEAKEYEVEFDFEGLLRTSLEDRMTANQVAIQSGQLTPNEARASEWKPALPGGDQLFMQGAMLPIDKLGLVPAKPIQPEGNANGT